MPQPVLKMTLDKMQRPARSRRLSILRSRRFTIPEAVCGSGSWRDGELVEMRHAVCLGPKRDLAGAREGAIGHGEQNLAIEGYGEPVAVGVHAQRMPGI